MRIYLLILIIFSYLFHFPLAKKNFLFAENGEKILYRVRKGDNLGQIARKFKVSTHDIESWNPGQDSDHIRRGQTLVIYKEMEASPLSFGEAIILKQPVDRWEILQGYRPYGDTKNLGVVLKVADNSTIKPATSGTIVKISQLRGYGKYILIDHGKGWHSMYSNLSHINVKLGQHVDLSDIIGNANNNKLFFLLAYNGKPVNPVGYFKRKQ